MKLKRFTIDFKSAKLVPKDKTEILATYRDNNTSGARFIASEGVESRMTGYVTYQSESMDKPKRVQLKRITTEDGERAFDWIMDTEATKNSGKIMFSLCFKSGDDEYNTGIYADTIQECLEAEDEGEDESNLFKGVLRVGRVKGMTYSEETDGDANYISAFIDVDGSQYNYVIPNVSYYGANSYDANGHLFKGTMGKGTNAISVYDPNMSMDGYEAVAKKVIITFKSDTNLADLIVRGIIENASSWEEAFPDEADGVTGEDEFLDADAPMA